MFKFHFSTVLAIFFLFTAKGQTTVILSPVKDNSIYQSSTGNSNGAGENIFAGNNNLTSPRRALIMFDIAAQIPAGATITAATLTLFCNQTAAGNSNVAIHQLLADWGESTSNAGSSNDGSGIAAVTNDATWLNRFHPSTAWGAAGGDFTATASATTVVGAANASYTWTSLQVTADVQNWLNNAAANFGWIVIGDEAVSQTAKRFASRENATSTARPQLSVTYTGAVPVLLSSFNATEINDEVLLNWVTAQELNNAFFLIEHSTDGIHFSPVGKVTGAGNAAGFTSYQFRDKGLSRGRHFYRLVQTDINGHVQYSMIKTVLINKENLSLQITPNPVSDKIILPGFVNRPGNSYAIISRVGKLISSGILNNNEINIKPLATGSYYLRIQTPDGSVFTGTFLKH